MTDYDAELRRHDAVLRAACRVRPAEHVLDIGCGTGHTTRYAASAGRSALGVDLSAPAIERARALSAGIDNVAYEIGDAQVHPFAPQRYDLAMSRFGTMFFTDPAVAFAHIAGALRPDGRLVLLVWQTRDRNEWAVAIQQALATSPEPGAPDAFSLGDPATVRRILTGAGFADVACTDVDEPVHYGPDVDAALDWVLGFSGPQDRDATDRLRHMLAGHRTADGVLLGSRAWLVTARRA